MDNVLTTFFSDLFGRLHGPLSFRFVLQPVMALIYATRDGLADARAGRPPYFWTMFTKPEDRGRLLREGWKVMTRVIVLGAAIDAVYQLMVFHRFHPVQLVVVVLLLAFLPYVMMRGPIQRFASRRPRGGPPVARPFETGADDGRRRNGTRRHA